MPGRISQRRDSPARCPFAHVLYPSVRARAGGVMTILHSGPGCAVTVVMGVGPECTERRGLAALTVLHGQVARHQHTAAPSAAKERGGPHSDTATGQAVRITMQPQAIPVAAFACVAAPALPYGRSAAIALRRARLNNPLIQRRLNRVDVVRF